MSAMNVFVSDDRIDLFTDTVIYDLAKNGAVHGFGSKVIPLPHQGAVLAGTGYSWVTIFMAGAIAGSGAERFDDLAENISTIVQKEIASMPAAASTSFGKFEILIAGFSEKRNAAEAYVLYGYSHLGWPAYHVKKFKKYVSPAANVPKFDEAEPSASGLAIMEAQRAALCGTLDAPGVQMHCVGGAAQHTTILPNGISMAVLKRWPDAIGLPVQA